MSLNELKAGKCTLDQEEYYRGEEDWYCLEGIQKLQAVNQKQLLAVK